MSYKAKASAFELNQIIDNSIPLSLGNIKPAWMMCSYSDNHWLVNDVGSRPKKSIQFDVLLPNGKRLTEYPHLVDTIKRIVYGVRTGPLMTVESGYVQAGIASNLIILARWMIANKINSFSEITHADIKEYVNLASSGVHSIVNFEGYLNLHINKLINSVDFKESDSEYIRLEKVISVFPHYFATPSHKTPMLNRLQLIADAGLEGIGVAASNSLGTSILDEIEFKCGFYQSLKITRRRKNPISLDELDESSISTEHLRRLIMPFEYLYRHRRFLDDSIKITPFPMSSASAEAKKYGKAIGRTESVPVKQAATLIEQSIRWVLEYAPIILDLKCRGDALFDNNNKNSIQKLNNEIASMVWPASAPSCPFPILPGRIDLTSRDFDDISDVLNLRQGMTLSSAIKFLLTACATVIAAFTARRASEILGLTAGCIEYDESKKPWMKIFIYKTVQGNVVIPVPEVVASAVSVLEKFSQRSRMQTDTQFIFQYNVPGTNVCYGISSEGLPIFDLGGFLSKFGYFVDVPMMEDGTKWLFKPHQFRRFFAILYIWIYELGDWDALSFHLRHFNPEMTKRYVTDSELGQIISLANKEHTAQIIANAALGKSEIAGLGGKRLKEAAMHLYAKMNQRVQVVSERKFVQRISRYVDRAGITLHAMPWGFCAASIDKANSGCECSESKFKPEFTQATISTCKDCVFSIRSGASLPYLNGTIKFHEKITQSQNLPIILRNASKVLTDEVNEYILSISSQSM